MSDHAARKRQWLLLKRLRVRNRGLTVAKLARELEVSQKTIRRDLATLKIVGFPVEETAGDYERKTYRLDPDWRILKYLDRVGVFSIYGGGRRCQVLRRTGVRETVEEGRFRESDRPGPRMARSNPRPAPPKVKIYALRKNVPRSVD